MTVRNFVNVVTFRNINNQGFGLAVTAEIISNAFHQHKVIDKIMSADALPKRFESMVLEDNSNIKTLLSEAVCKYPQKYPICASTTTLSIYELDNENKTSMHGIDCINREVGLMGMILIHDIPVMMQKYLSQLLDKHKGYFEIVISFMKIKSKTYLMLAIMPVRD